MLFRKANVMIVALAIVAICAFAASNAEAASLRILNNSASDLHAIYLSSSGSNDWEENVIEGKYLPSGNKLTINVRVKYQQFDLRVEDKDGNYEDYFEFPGNTRAIVIHGGGECEYE